MALTDYLRISDCEIIFGLLLGLLLGSSPFSLFLNIPYKYSLEELRLPERRITLPTGEVVGCTMGGGAVEAPLVDSSGRRSSSDVVGVA